MKILQNETTNNTTTNSTGTTPNSKEKIHLQQTSFQPHQQLVEKRKAKTLKNKILQNVAQQQQQQQQEEHFQQQQQQQRQKQHHQNAIANNNKNNTPSAMTDERTKINYNNNCNSSKTTNTKSSEIKTTTTTTAAAAATAAASATATATHFSKDTLKDLSTTSRSHNNANNNNNSDLIIAEAAKILLKNGLNGTNAAAAAAVATATATLLTAAANFHQLPTVSNTISTSKGCLTTSASSTTGASVSDTSALGGNVTTAAAAAHAQLVAIAAAAAAVNATNQKRLAALPTTTLSTATSSPTCKSPNQFTNNGSLDNIGIQATSASTSVSTSSVGVPAQFTKPYKTNSCRNAMPSSMDKAIFDYSVNFNTSNNNASAVTTSSSLSSTSSSSSPSCAINLSALNNNSNSSNSNSVNVGQQKYLNNNIHSHSNRPDIGRTAIAQHHHQTANVNNKNGTSGGYGGGGRLQFFKDGKFILELARSKEGEKEGWVSVPRKLFRTPSAATSSTVTPSATASTSAAVIPSTLAASPAAVVGGTSYPKNECSNSLSFSDDNSSLQSSPWQRDHCWKQAAPRKNVSKELNLCYHRPASLILTTEALLLSYRKRRKPLDPKTLQNALIFALNNKKQIEQKKLKLQADSAVVSNKDAEKVVTIKKTELVISKQLDKGDDNKSVKSDMDDAKTNTDDTKRGCIDANGDRESTNGSEPFIKTESEISETNESDIEMAKPLSPSKGNVNQEAKSLNAQKEMSADDKINKMITSDCVDDEQTSPKINSTSSNGVISNEDVLQETKQDSAMQEEYLKTGDEEKRLKKHENYKTRAKLTTIVQKLIDVSTTRLAATAHPFKKSNAATSTTAASFTSIQAQPLSSTSSNNASATGGGKTQNSKVSPPSNTAASRLVEYHQQHVSPRKRILREFEKVSLEDNSSGASAGKRSRAKANNTSTSSTNSNMASSSSSAITTSSKSITLNTHNLSAAATPKSVATAPPTKLYSSYSIHSLLGGGVSTPAVQTPPTKKSNDLPATITSSSMAYAAYHSGSYNLNSMSNNSPKSPEANNVSSGKSPSNSATKSKRSPPYSSPMRETSSRSPITCVSGGYTEYGGRRSPRTTPDTAHNTFNKLRYATGVGTDGTVPPSNHHLQQHHLQQHFHHQPQTYYSPYMMSPHYVPPITGPNALSPNAASTNASTSSSTTARSPRHHASAFRAATPTSASSSTHNIPSTQKGDLSPPRSTTASPRETTPRTVPKKTASIRRQFASPTSASIQNHNNSNCSSPTTTIDEQLTSDRRTPVNSGTPHQLQQQQQHLMQRGSPSNPNLSASPIHPYSYLYAQPSNATNSVGSNHPSSSMSPSSANASASAAAAAAAAAAASYIPAVVGSPYYHPYISTLAAMRHPQMWMQHYQTAAAAAANPALMQARHPAMLSTTGAGSRLSPPYHGFQYNGMSNAAALAAAAAAAAGFGSAASPPHLPNALAHPSSMFNPIANSSLLGMQHPVTAMQAAGLVPASAVAAALPTTPSITDASDLSKSSKNNFSPSTSTSNLGVLTGLSTTTASPGRSMYNINNDDEQSSDVPLNLSKH